MNSNIDIVIVVIFDILLVALAQATCGSLCPPGLELKADEVIAGGTCGCNPDLAVDTSSTSSCNCGGVWEQTCGDLNGKSLSLTDVETDSRCEEIQSPRIVRLCCRGDSNSNFICGDGGGEMTDPQRQLFQGVSCQSISDMLSLLDHNPMFEQTEAFYQDELELLKFDIDWASLCGCTDSPQPKKICSVCGGNESLEIQNDGMALYAPDDYPFADACNFPPYLTCPQAIAISKSITNVTSCDGWLLPVNTSCCMGETTNYKPSYAGDCGHILEAAGEAAIDMGTDTAIDTSTEEDTDTSTEKDIFTEAAIDTSAKISTEEGTVNSSSAPLKIFPFVALVIGIVSSKL